MQQALGYIIVRASRIGREYSPADFRCAKHFAFKREVGELVRTVQDPECTVELEAVRDDRLRAQIDVLGSEIAVSFNNPLAPHTIVQESTLAANEIELCDRYFSNEIGGQTPYGSRELMATTADLRFEASTIVCRVDRDGGACFVEADQCGNSDGESPASQAVALDLLLQHVALS